MTNKKKVSVTPELQTDRLYQPDTILVPSETNYQIADNYNDSVKTKRKIKENNKEKAKEQIPKILKK